MLLFLALAQYSGDPRTEWQLNAHRDKKSLLQAVANLPYKGGNTLTGESGCFGEVLTQCFLVRQVAER